MDGEDILNRIDSRKQSRRDERERLEAKRQQQGLLYGILYVLHAHGRGYTHGTPAWYLDSEFDGHFDLHRRVVKGCASESDLNKWAHLNVRLWWELARVLQELELSAVLDEVKAERAEKRCGLVEQMCAQRLDFAPVDVFDLVGALMKSMTEQAGGSVQLTKKGLPRKVGGLWCEYLADVATREPLLVDYMAAFFRELQRVLKDRAERRDSRRSRSVGELVPKVAEDFSWIVYGEDRWEFKGDVQRRAVAVLWQDYLVNGDRGGIHEGTIAERIDAADNSARWRVEDRFRGNPALGTLIVSAGPATWRLSFPPQAPVPG